MFASTFHREMTRLAFVAALLLLIMPTSGRLMAAWSGGDYGPDLQRDTPAGSMTAMQTSHDALASRAVAPDEGAVMHGDAHTGMPHGEGMCPYCPLLGSMATVQVIGTLATAAIPRHADWAWLPRPLAAPVSSTGLGPRGPPRVL